MQDAILLKYFGIVLPKAAGRLEATALRDSQVDDEGALFHLLDQLLGDHVTMSRIDVAHGADHDICALEGVQQYVGMEGRGEKLACAGLCAEYHRG